VTEVCGTCRFPDGEPINHTGGPGECVRVAHWLEQHLTFDSCMDESCHDPHLINGQGTVYCTGVGL
jgi:hypothetical protein